MEGLGQVFNGALYRTYHINCVVLRLLGKRLSETVSRSITRAWTDDARA